MHESHDQPLCAYFRSYDLEMQSRSRFFPKWYINQTLLKSNEKSLSYHADTDFSLRQMDRWWTDRQMNEQGEFSIPYNLVVTYKFPIHMNNFCRLDELYNLDDLYLGICMASMNNLILITMWRHFLIKCCLIFCLRCASSFVGIKLVTTMACGREWTT